MLHVQKHPKDYRSALKTPPDTAETQVEIAELKDTVARLEKTMTDRGLHRALERKGSSFGRSPSTAGFRL